MRNRESKQIKRELKNARLALSKAERDLTVMRAILAENQKRLEGLRAGRSQDLAPGITPEQAVALLDAAISAQQQVLARGDCGLEPMRQMVRLLESPGMTLEKANAIAEAAARDSHRNFAAHLNQSPTLQ